MQITLLNRFAMSVCLVYMKRRYQITHLGFGKMSKEAITCDIL